eukprot:TRINITY_DN2808_c0_g1_i1.p2 TRINITY_DN2808_c0_g1~~TRINITY_DN2808_c0_g1_i1.p2  ORF type:complete len:119 (-),score=25.20 TRINITY_DN2808_c0_g1_i1:62-418(-)
MKLKKKAGEAGDAPPTGALQVDVQYTIPGVEALSCVRKYVRLDGDLKEPALIKGMVLQRYVELVRSCLENPSREKSRSFFPRLDGFSDFVRASGAVMPGKFWNDLDGFKNMVKKHAGD